MLQWIGNKLFENATCNESLTTEYLQSYFLKQMQKKWFFLTCNFNNSKLDTCKLSTCTVTGRKCRREIGERQWKLSPFWQRNSQRFKMEEKIGDDARSKVVEDQLTAEYRRTTEQWWWFGWSPQMNAPCPQFPLSSFRSYLTSPLAVHPTLPVSPIPMHQIH